tara:strand:- start:344 stop:493 length:150 start_codon:yes stop_codon:yes gene_type:complete
LQNEKEITSQIRCSAPNPWVKPNQGTNTQAIKKDERKIKTFNQIMGGLE